MGPELDRLRGDLKALGALVSQIEERVAQLERAPRTAVSPSQPPSVVESKATEPPPPAELPAELDLRGWAALMGRSLIVLGGAYLLRAITELHLVPVGVGASLGLLYASVSIGLAARAAQRGASLSASFHGATALALGVPLIDELVVRFQLIGPAASAWLLALFGGAVIAVALRRRHAALLWIASVATAVAAGVLVVQTRGMVPYLWLLAAVTAALGWAARRSPAQRFVAWPPTIVGAFLALLLSQLVLAGRSFHTPPSALLAMLAFLGAAAVSMVAEASPLELSEAAFVLLCVLLQGTRVALELGGRGWFDGLALAICLAQLLLRWRSAPWSCLWLTGALVALAGLASGGVLALACVVLAAVLLLATRADSVIAELQVAAALVAAAAASGLLGFAVNALTAPPSVLTAPSIVALGVLIAIAAAALSRPRPALLALTLVGVAGLAAWAAIVSLAAAPSIAATVRTAVLASGAIAVGLLSRHPRARAAGHLIAPVLLLGGIKLLVEDFRVGTAGSLFVALALYGVALIVAPRLRANPRKTCRP